MPDHAKPLPRLNADTKTFWEGCRSQRLTFQKCGDCGHVRWPAAILCPQCHSRNTQWIVSSGRGKVYSFIVYHKTFHPAFERELPYVVAIVEMEEGPHLLSNIVGCSPGEVTCEMPVTVTFEDRGKGFHVPLFRPAG